VDGGECLRACQRSAEAQKETPAPDFQTSDRKVDESKQKEQEIRIGFLAEDLEAFMWLVEWTEANILTHEIWFNKLCYYYLEGVYTHRRRLNENEVPKF